eukprot:7549131-Pyramimonas_sp.AAC.1
MNDPFTFTSCLQQDISFLVMRSLERSASNSPGSSDRPCFDVMVSATRSTKFEGVQRGPTKAAPWGDLDS